MKEMYELNYKSKLNLMETQIGIDLESGTET